MPRSHALWAPSAVGNSLMAGSRCCTSVPSTFKIDQYLLDCPDLYTTYSGAEFATLYSQPLLVHTIVNLLGRRMRRSLSIVQLSLLITLLPVAIAYGERGTAERYVS
jgi:hypothetical protein